MLLPLFERLNERPRKARSRFLQPDTGMDHSGGQDARTSLARTDQPLVAIVGYGRFGRALAHLFLDHGIAVRAYDSHVSIPVALASPALEQVAHEATHLLLAVPIAEIPAVLKEIRPFLTESQVIFDVGSVKVRPVRMFIEILGDRAPWVGTHPLFGPASLARAEKPLRVVVCPNKYHPDAAERVKMLYAAIDCDIVEESPESHDRRMAETHALAFFVAKGILDAHLGVDVPHAPPSFQSIMRTVEVVRSDAGHLFTTIERENPYAADVRKKFMNTLANIDASLREEKPPVMDGEATSQRWALSRSLEEVPDLRETRESIDEMDRDIVALLARRMELARRAWRAKMRLGLGIVDPVREAELMEGRRTWALQEGLDANGVTEIFEAILRLSRNGQYGGG